MKKIKIFLMAILIPADIINNGVVMTDSSLGKNGKKIVKEHMG